MRIKLVFELGKENSKHDSNHRNQEFKGIYQHKGQLSCQQKVWASMSASMIESNYPHTMSEDTYVGN